MAGLGWASRTIAMGTAYALWTGAGAALTVGYAMVFGVEQVSVGKLIFVIGIIGSVIGLKLTYRWVGRHVHKTAEFLTINQLPHM